MPHPSDPPAAVLGRLTEFAKAATARAWWHPELASLRVSVGDGAGGARALARELGAHLEPGALELKAGLGPPRSSGWRELKLAAAPVPPPPRKTLGAHVAQDWVNSGWLGVTPADPTAIAQGDPTRALVPPPAGPAAPAEPEPDADAVAADQALAQARAVDALLSSGDAALKAASRRGTGLGTSLAFGFLAEQKRRKRPEPKPEPEEPEDPAVAQYNALDRLLSDEEAAAKAAAWWANLGR